MRAFENTKINDRWANQAPDFADTAHLVIYFSSTQLSKETDIYQELRSIYPHAIIVGCSTGGEIQNEDVYDDSIVANAIKFNSTELKLAQKRVSDTTNSYDAGKSIGQDLLQPNLKCVIVISDGLQVNGSELIRGITSIIGKNIPVTGGLAGDGDRFQETYVCANGPAEQGLIAAIGLYGDKIVIRHGCAGGWDAFGPERIITKSKANVLFELDGQPALDLYKAYLGEEANNLPGSALLFPLTIRPANSKDYTVVRTILAVNEQDKSMTFAGDMPEGHVAQLMRGNMDHLVEGAAQAARNAKYDEGSGDQVALLVSCIGRKLLMGQLITDEIEAVKSIIGDQAKMIGFYSYGEISPHAASGMCELHNQTMTITTLMESA